MEPSNKRQKTTQIQSYERSISPPARRNGEGQSATSSQTARERAAKQVALRTKNDTTQRSPFRLTKIADLDDLSNVDCISLSYILGDPKLKEVWLFDFLFDLDFVIRHFHPSKKDTIQVKIVHGSWKQESEQRQALERYSKKYDHVEVICAYMPEPFGTHHTKMMVLFKEDSQAQVVIHTANMISFDWANMTQGAWFSPWMSRLDNSTDNTGNKSYKIGSGERFKVDLLRYLREYKRKTEKLITALDKYDFSSIRAAFIGCAPTKHKPADANPAQYTSFGWPGLKQILQAIAAQSLSQTADDVVAIQVSSIATLSEKWMDNFTETLHTNSSRTLNTSNPRSKTRLIFPTAEEVRTSLNGYISGSSIHLKGASASQQKQLQWLRRMFCTWGGSDQANIASNTLTGHAMRSLAAPHIKTFVRYSQKLDSISWALMTSANLSTQAWGALPDKDGVVRISSWEVGVVVWPELFQETENEVCTMVPLFGKDTLEDGYDGDCARTIIPLRLPYNLPFKRYTQDDQPWCKDVRHTTPDINGETWT